MHDNRAIITTEVILGFMEWFPSPFRGGFRLHPLPRRKTEEERSKIEMIFPLTMNVTVHFLMEVQEEDAFPKIFDFATLAKLRAWNRRNSRFRQQGAPPTSESCRFHSTSGIYHLTAVPCRDRPGRSSLFYFCQPCHNSPKSAADPGSESVPTAVVSGS